MTGGAALFGVILLLSVEASGALLRPFSSDGCSAFPNGTLEQKQLWLHCCAAHDRRYWRGGTYAERLQADKALRECVERVGEAAIADLMMAGVRVGGSPFWPTRFRWGYGWDYPRVYKALTDEEERQIQLMELEENPLP